MMEKELFTLLRLGLAITNPEEEKLSGFVKLSSEQWASIGDCARKQGVLGIMLDGIERLESSRKGLTRELNEALETEWIGEVLQIEHNNHHQIVVLNDLAGEWIRQGCRVMVMKGQANGGFYPKPEHRNPGDIDCYLFEDYARGNEIARQKGAIVDESWYKHSVINYKGETFENHQYFVHTRDGKRGKKLNQDLVEQLKDKSEEIIVLPGTDVEKPSAQWTALFLTYHACAHFISEGLRLKQILDWAMFLGVHQTDVDWPAFYAFCDKNHLRVFADAMNSIAVKYLGVKVNSESLGVKESPYADKVLHSALYDDDYIFSSGKSGWTNRLHLVKNMFHYRWKYEEIYQTCVWKQLWWYVSGYLFKTE